MRMRRKLDTFIGQTKNIPTNYTECEYLESNGQQYLNTEHLVSSSCRLSVTAEIVRNINAFTCIFAARGLDNNSTDSYQLFDATLSTAHGLILRPYQTTNWIKPAPTEKIQIEFTDTVILIDGVQRYRRNSADVTPTDPLALFASWKGDGKGFVRIYSCVVTDEHASMNLIPCLDENKRPCMYDLISGRTIYNTANANKEFGYKIKATGEVVAPEE